MIFNHFPSHSLELLILLSEISSNCFTLAYFSDKNTVIRCSYDSNFNIVVELWLCRFYKDLLSYSYLRSIYLFCSDYYDSYRLSYLVLSSPYFAILSSYFNAIYLCRKFWPKFEFYLSEAKLISCNFLLNSRFSFSLL